MWDLMNASLKALLNEQYKLVAELREDNKKLKEWNNELIENHKKDIDILCKENKTLNEKVRFLEECLDRKEKLNEEYRKEIDKYKRQYEHSMWEDDELIYEEWLYD